MAKDQFWFKHESNTQDDPRHMEMIEDLGMEGYGIYWAIKEKLRSAEGYTLPLSVIKRFARIWGTTAIKVQTVIEKYGLFQVHNDRFFCPEMCEKMTEIKERATHAAIVKWDKERAKLLIDRRNVDADALQPDSGRNADAMPNDAYKIREDKKRIDKNRTNKNKHIPPTEESDRFVNWFLTLLAEDIASRAKTASWHGQYQKLINSGYDKLKIARACQWARTDDFWKTNFYSPAKLTKTNEDGILYIDLFLEKAAAEETKKTAAAQKAKEPAFTVPTTTTRTRYNED